MKPNTSHRNNFRQTPIIQVKQCCPYETLIYQTQTVEQIISNSQALRMYQNYKKTSNRNHSKISLKKQIKGYKQYEPIKQIINQSSIDNQQKKMKQDLLSFKNILGQLQQDDALKTDRIVSYDEFKSGIQKSESQSLFRFSKNIKEQSNSKKIKLKQTDFSHGNKKDSISDINYNPSVKKIKKSLSSRNLNIHRLENQNHWLFGSNSDKQEQNIARKSFNGQKPTILSNQSSSKDIHTNMNTLKVLQHRKSQNTLGTSNSLRSLRSISRVMSQRYLQNRYSFPNKVQRKQLQIQEIAEQQEFQLTMSSPKIFQLNKHKFDGQRFFPQKPKINKTISFSSILDLPQQSISIAEIRKKNSEIQKTPELDFLKDQCIQSSFQFYDLSQPRNSTLFNEKIQEKDKNSTERNQNPVSLCKRKPCNFFYSMDIKKKDCNRKLQNMIRAPVESIVQLQQRQNSEVLMNYRDYMKHKQQNTIVDSVQSLIKQNIVKIRPIGLNKKESGKQQNNIQQPKIHRYINIDQNKLMRNQSLSFLGSQPLSYSAVE